MIDKDFEMQMEQVQEMSWEDVQQLLTALNDWDSYQEPDCNGDELLEWSWN